MFPSVGQVFRRRRAQHAPFGHEDVDALVVRLARDLVHDLEVEAHADPNAPGTQAGEEAVVVPAALAETPPIGVERETRDDDDVGAVARSRPDRLKDAAEARPHRAGLVERHELEVAVDHAGEQDGDPPPQQGL